uniref:Peroxisomal membrane protein MPV17 n=1 Tax=Bicosoecida sp. CB-2014 TaxID=1486930 RepID=A0A7S1CGT8_9STRA|mmetsp:Transcript_24460/g.85037  ORF Transcript_24460/g.85037 Transcript_24460/m.85037 type:complete len:287 (+) Transcript_24460:71-931(+)
MFVARRVVAAPVAAARTAVASSTAMAAAPLARTARLVPSRAGVLLAAPRASWSTARGAALCGTPVAGFLGRALVVRGAREGWRRAGGWRRKFSAGGSGGGGGGGKKSLWERYAELLETRPILTKSLTSLVITAIGDIACQTFFGDGSFDIVRFAQFSILGGVLVGPGLHFWYGTLNRLIPGVTTKAVLGRLALDQLVWAPPFIAVFMGTLKTMQGRPYDDLLEIVWESCKVNWMLWPAANFINFKFVPGQYQVLFANFVALIWNTYLSYAGNKPAAEAVEAETPAV